MPANDNNQTANAKGVGFGDWLGTQVYMPEIWQVPKDAIYFAIPAVEAGLEYTRELLANHDVSLGRTTRKNKLTAEAMERDIEQMLKAIKYLRACGPNAEVSDPSGNAHEKH